MTPLIDSAIVILLLAPHVLVAAVTIVIRPSEPLRWDWWLVLGCALVMTFLVSRGGTLHVLRLAGLAVPAPSRIVEMVNQSGAELGLRDIRVYELRWSSANAIALPMMQRVCPDFREQVQQVFSMLEEPGARLALGH